MEDVDIEKVLVPKAISFGDTLLVTCTVDYKVKRLHIMLPKTTVYVKSYDGETKLIYFLIKDDVYLKYYLG